MSGLELLFKSAKALSMFFYFLISSRLVDEDKIYLKRLVAKNKIIK